MKYQVTFTIPVETTKTVYADSLESAIRFVRAECDPYNEASDWSVEEA